MNIAILCGHPESPYARQILGALNASGFSGVHIIAAEPPRRSNSIRALWRKYGLSLPIAVARWTLRWVTSALAGDRNGQGKDGIALSALVDRQAGRFVVVADVNGEMCRTTLESMAVDLLILGGAPIVRDPVLRVPRLGTLNAHQGPLPRYRGMNVLEWAILEGTSPSVTVHFVNEGVDTGDIVAVEPVPVRPGDNLETLKKRAAELQVDLLTQSVRAALQGRLPRLRQASLDGRQYFVMHPQIRRLAEDRFSALRELSHLEVIQECQP
jgi:folate-dependent phosphoribosylglycinamide formyltransferase PurN